MRPPSSRCRRWLPALVIFVAGPVFGASVDLQADLAHPVVSAQTRQTGYLRVSLTGEALPDAAKRPPVNVAVVIDRSGSMRGQKIEHARRAAIEAIGRLRARDTVTLISYADEATVEVPATSADQTALLTSPIHAITAGGGTALHAGVSQAGDELRNGLGPERVNRIVLLSDGMATNGPKTAAELGALGKRLLEEGIHVTTLGIGANYNEDLMTRLAQKSDGNHAFVQTAEELPTFFAKEFGDGLSIVAREARVAIDFAEGVTPLDIMNMDGEIDGTQVRVPFHQIYADHQRYVLVKVQLPASPAGEVRSIGRASFSCVQMQTGKAMTQTMTPAVEFSNDPARVRQAARIEIQVSVAEQIASRANAEAIKLRDAGKVAEAKKVLLENAAYLDEEADRLGSDLLRQQAAENRKDAEAVEDAAQYNVRRKAMQDRRHYQLTRPCM